MRIGDRVVRGLRPFLQNNMRVCPAKAKRTDPGPTGYGIPVFTPESFPVPGLFHHIKGGIMKFDIRIECLKMGGSGQFPVLHGKDHLDHACDAGRRLQMSHVGLDRSKPAIRCLLICFFLFRFIIPRMPIFFCEQFKGFFYAFDLHRVSQFRASAVQFQKSYGFRRYPRISIS